MTRTTNEQGFISTVYEEKTHEDLQNCLFACFLSQVEPKKVIQALTDPSWIEAMQDELLHFKLQKVWTLVDLPYSKRAIRTKWVYRNKKDERGIVIRNKARLVAQGYTQEEGIDYDDVFAPVARIEAIMIFLAYASFKDFVVFQMDMKSAFLYGKIEEEVYVYQPLGFEDPEFPDRVYKVEKALYGLHQAPRAWYETLSTYLLDNGFQRGQIDKTLFIKRIKSDILLMSSIGELTFFLGLQVSQKDDGIFISQDKYVDEILKKFGFSTVKTASTPMETSKPLLKDAKAEVVDVHLYRSMIGSLMYLTASRPDIMFDVCACARFQVIPKVSHLHAVKKIFRCLKGQPKLALWYPKDSLFNLEAYTDSDYASASLDRKSTTRAEYVAATSCCGQVLWIQNRMLDYGHNFMNTKIYINNKSTICIVKNPVFHSKTKHIEIRYHFIKDSNKKKLIQMSKIHTDHNVADLLTKAFDVVVPGCQDTTLEGAEAQIRFETASKQSNDLPLSRVNILRSEEHSIKLKELMNHCTKVPEKQFWNTATAKTLDNGKMEITATIDGKVKIVSEASIMRHLKLKDSDGISNFFTTEIFEQLALMGNMRRASKGYTRADIPLFPTMLVQGPVVQGEGSTVPVESHHTPTIASSTSQQPSSSPSRRTTRQEYVVPQPKSPTQTNVADEAASTGVDVRHGGAATIVTSLDAGQGSGNIDKTWAVNLGEISDLGPRKNLSSKSRCFGDRLVANKESLWYCFYKAYKKVKKLEKIVKTRQARRNARIVVSDDEEDLENPSKQGRKIAKIDQDPDISLVQHDAEVQGKHEHDMEPDFEFTTAEEVYTTGKEVSTAEPVSTASASVSTAGASSAKDKVKAIIEEAETIQTKTKLQLEQERLGYKEALRLQAEIDEEERQRIARVQEEATHGLVFAPINREHPNTPKNLPPCNPSTSRPQDSSCSFNTSPPSCSTRPRPDHEAILVTMPPF
ncbi:putative ribonuclease H-like domain-containing protein [Tanacetum coccineum]